jgi:outer membrane protein OmpA-like peptidoglycan-associated protein
MQKRISYCLVYLLFFVSFSALAQNGSLPENLGPSINSVYDEINPVISPDGKTLFFTRVNHPENTFGENDSEDIWFSTLQTDGTWSSATRLLHLNIGRYNAVLSVSEDGNTLLLNGVYNRKGNAWKKRGVSISTKVGNDWSIPEPLKIPSLAKSNSGIKSSASMSADGNFLVLSFSTIYNSERSDIFIARKKKNGNWSSPKKIRKVNSKASDDAPFLSADNKTLYFASDRKGKNAFDIYKTVRKTDTDRWSAPTLLSDTINSDAWDSYFKTNSKGTIGYFSSTRQLVNGADIYKVTIIEENPFVIVSGKIKNASNGHLIFGRNFTVKVEGYPVDSVALHLDSASYSVSLPLGKRYVISASLPEFHSIPDTIDVTNTRSFAKMNNDLFVQPLPYVLVQGKLRVNNSAKTIPPASIKNISINGIPVDSVRIDTVNAVYEVKLMHGKAYTISLNADGFVSSPASLDLSNIDQYQKIALDLYAEPEKVKVVIQKPEVVEEPVAVEVAKSILISGRVINKKTGDAFANSALLKITVEGTSSAPELDRSSGKYSVSLSTERSYTISANAPGFYPIYETLDLVNSTESEITKDLYIVPVEVGQSIRLNNVFFESGKAKLKKESYPELQRVVSFLEDNSDLKIEISGHTDNVGDASTNQRLSLARAKAVAAYIISKGIKASRLVSQGYGFERPVTSNATEAGRSQNRRVEFTILTR